MGPALRRSRPSRISPHPAGRAGAAPHLHQAADDVPDHVVEEAVGGDEHGEPVAPGQHPRRAHGARGRAVPTRRRAEGREVVLAPEDGEDPAASRRHRAGAGDARRDGGGRDRRWRPDRSGRDTACPAPSAGRRSPRAPGARRSRAPAPAARRSARGAAPPASSPCPAERLATWRRACTPASVRLAPVTLPPRAPPPPGARRRPSADPAR